MLKKYYLTILLLLTPLCFGSEQYLTSAEFLTQTFGKETPASKVLWLSPEQKLQTEKILTHSNNVLRVRYWPETNKSAWIFDEIGKEKPITIGIVIENSAIKNVSILQFRESRGWEVRYPFFTERFKGVRLQNNQLLDKKIDGITGATLSVNAVVNVSRLALYLDTQIPE